MEQRKYTRISEAELDQVALLRAQGVRVSDIARTLGRAKSSISELITINKDSINGHKWGQG
jgi:IS30 family transposase